MSTRIPRTAAEFRDQHRRVVAHCARCTMTTYVDPDSLVQWLGSEGDVYKNFADLAGLASCGTCGGSIEQVTFTNLARRSFEPVSFEDSLIAHLELLAFAKARDAAAWHDPRRPPTQPSRRVRRFGRR